DGRAKRLDVNADTAQRLKRLESIIRKLSLRPTMQLSQMQDIGGYRAGGGSTEWKRFFQLIGAVHASIEKTAPVPGTPSDEKKLKREVRQLEAELRVTQLLQSFAQMTSHITGPRGKDRDWFLIEMLPEE